MAGAFFVGLCLGFFINPATGETIKTATVTRIVLEKIPDSLPKTINDTVVIPFDYQQSSLNFDYTFRLIDSAINILLSDDSIKLSIDGYSHVEEANSNICYWLSMNRALAVKSYIIGRGVDSSRIDTIKALSSRRSVLRKKKKESVRFNCTAEIILSYPLPPPPLAEMDMDGDGIMDKEDSCVNEYGERSRNGCPDKNAIIVPFEQQQSALYTGTYVVLDSIISLLRKNPTFTISINGYAYPKEGVESFCETLAMERADIVKRYLLTRQVDAVRIDSVKSYGTLKPITAGRNPQEISRNSRVEIYLDHH